MRAILRHAQARSTMPPAAIGRRTQPGGRRELERRRRNCNSPAFLMPKILASCWLLLAFAAAQARAEDEELFALTTLPHQGRAVAAELADLDGDGRLDLFVVRLTGLPPREERSIGVHLQRVDGGFNAAPDHRIALPEWSAVYDMADLRPEAPGAELVLLQPDGVLLLSLASADAPRWKLAVPGATTAGLADDERGFEPYPLVYRDFGTEPWILAPQLGELTALSPQGEVHARVALPRRANYFIVPRTGLLSIESDFQIFVDAPKLHVGDVDGDGRADLVSSTRHEIRVFLQRASGGFDFEPSRRLALGLVTPRDHIRGSGGVSCDARDLDGDGRLDLAITHVRGSITDASTDFYLHRNRGGAWDLARPDQKLSWPGSATSHALLDLEGDGRLELLRGSFRFGVLEVAELLLRQRVDLHFALHRLDATGGFAAEPISQRSLALPFRFETFRPSGFVPAANVDWNGDGRLDFTNSRGGRGIEIHPGSAQGFFAERSVRQDFPSAGVLHAADFDADGLQDFVLFDPHNFDVPVTLGRNLGRLPGTAPRIEAAP